MSIFKRAAAGLAGLTIVVGTVAACELAPPAGAVTTTTRPTGKLVPAQGTYLGAFSSNGSWAGNTDYFAHYAARESVAGRKFDIAHHFYGWSNPIPSGLEQWDIAGGRIPMITWQPSIGLDAINNGSQDAMITSRANGLKALNAPLFLRWGHEMNGNWYNWDGTHNNDSGTTNGPAKYVQAWRRVHDIFTAQGATNVVWVWEPGAQDIPNLAWNHWTNYYPGDSYVDWVGIDGYNWGTIRYPGWTSFESKFAPVYNDYASRKPIMVCETASTDLGGDKGQWIRDLVTTVKNRFPSMAAVTWFDQNKEADWRFDSSASSLSAFRTMAADPYFNPTTAPVTTTTASTTTTTTAPSSISIRVATTSGGTTKPLAGSVVSGKVYISATVSKPVSQLRFYLDNPGRTGTPTATERYAPYDLLGGDPLDTATLSTGSHTVTVAADLSAGGTEVTTATFTR
jgi:endoglucanase